MSDSIDIIIKKLQREVYRLDTLNEINTWNIKNVIKGSKKSYLPNKQIILMKLLQDLIYDYLLNNITPIVINYNHHVEILQENKQYEQIIIDINKINGWLDNFFYSEPKKDEVLNDL